MCMKSEQINISVWFFYNQSKEGKMLKQFNIDGYFYQVKKTILSCERCACFDSDCQRKARCVSRPRSASLVSDKSLSKQ